MSELRTLPGGAQVHRSSYVDDGAVVGTGTTIWHFCHVMGGSEIGERCNLGQNVVVMSGVRLGSNVKVQNNVSLYEGVVCEDDVFLGPSMVFTNVGRPRSHVPRRDQYERTILRRGVTVGANATIVCGVELGEFCFIGAGAVVTGDVPAHALMIGVPARRIGWVCRCGMDVGAESGSRDRLRCVECGMAYRRVASDEIERIRTESDPPVPIPPDEEG